MSTDREPPRATPHPAVLPQGRGDQDLGVTLAPPIYLLPTRDIVAHQWSQGMKTKSSRSCRT